jgi:hypothetical protein
MTSDSPPLSPEAASAPQDAPALRHTLHAAAAAVVTAWEASQPLNAAVTSLRAILASRPPSAPRAAGEPRKPRDGTKQSAVLALLRRPEGATVAQVVDATGWAPHTVRGFFAGLRTRQGIEVTVLERVRQVGPNKTGARGSYSVYQIAADRLMRATQHSASRLAAGLYRVSTAERGQSWLGLEAQQAIVAAQGWTLVTEFCDIAMARTTCGRLSGVADAVPSARFGAGRSAAGWNRQPTRCPSYWTETTQSRQGSGAATASAVRPGVARPARIRRRRFTQSAAPCA